MKTFLMCLTLVCMCATVDAAPTCSKDGCTTVVAQGCAGCSQKAAPVRRFFKRLFAR